jgi:predicted dithiol-disulfide oxidoreductase (DUF899 family)
MRNQVVSHEEWLKARLELLAAEKEFTRQRDALTRRRMAMPWEGVERPYRFEGPNGALSLADLFDGRSQLIVYHFMFGPDWEEGCKSCSFWADNFDVSRPHLNHRDVTFTAVARRTWRDVGCLPRQVSAAGVMFCTTPDIAGHRRGMARARRPRADISSITAAPLQLAERGPGTGKPSLTQ